MAEVIGTPSGAEGRTYQETHPWIDFRLDLSRASPEFWMLLGEARSKVQHIAGSLLRPEVAQEMHQVYLAKGVLGTTAIEGSTLSEEEVRKLVEGELELPPSQEYLAQAVDNIIEAYNEIKNQLLNDAAPILSPELLRDYNRLILKDLPLDEGVVPGEIPLRPPVVGRYRAAPREDCEFLLELLCDWVNGATFVPPNEDWAIPRALLKAMAAHLYVAWIHPYGDGNGRTARLIELRMLMEAGVPMPAAHLLSNHYNLTRDEYYRRLDAASKSQEGVVEFLSYGLRGFVDGLHDQLKRIREQQFADRWEQYIYESFAGRDTGTDRRRRELALAISHAGEPIARADLRRLTPELAERYADRTERTISRDVLILQQMGLIRKADEGEGFVPAREVLLAFLPVATAEPSVAPVLPVVP